MIIAIDGFSEADNIKEISRLGIDWIGLDFVADSPRRVRQLASLSGMLPDSPLLECAGLAPGSRLMGVFRDEMPQTIVTSIYNFHLDLVRLEGEESTVLIDNLRRTVDPTSAADCRSSRPCASSDAKTCCAPPTMRATPTTCSSTP